MGELSLPADSEPEPAPELDPEPAAELPQPDPLLEDALPLELLVSPPLEEDAPLEERVPCESLAEAEPMYPFSVEPLSSPLSDPPPSPRSTRIRAAPPRSSGAVLARLPPVVPSVLCVDSASLACASLACLCARAVSRLAPARAESQQAPAGAQGSRSAARASPRGGGALLPQSL